MSNTKMTVHIDPAAILKKRGLGESDLANILMAETVARLSDPYVPMAAGSGAHMKDSYEIATDGSKIIYPGPYAHYQYVGEIMGPNIPIMRGGVAVGFYSPSAPKYYTGRSLSYHGGGDSPARGKEWDKRMMADRGDEVTAAVAKYVGGKVK